MMALNKWDVTGTDIEEATRPGAPQKLRLRPRVLAVSARDRARRARLIAESLDLADRAAERIPTAELNRFLSDSRPSASRRPCRGKRLQAATT